MNWKEFKSKFIGSTLTITDISKLWKLYPKIITDKYVNILYNMILEFRIYLSDNVIPPRVPSNKRAFNYRIKKYLESIDMRTIVEIKDFNITIFPLTASDKKMLKSLGARYNSKTLTFSYTDIYESKIKSWLDTLDYRITYIKRKTLDELIKDVFNSEIDWIKIFPKEIIQNIILKTESKDILSFCLTSKHINTNICDEYFWSRVYEKKYGDKALFSAIKHKKLSIVRGILQYTKNIKINVKCNYNVYNGYYTDRIDCINIWAFIISKLQTSSDKIWSEIYSLLLDTKRIDKDERIDSIFYYNMYLDIQKKQSKIEYILKLYLKYMTVDNSFNNLLLELHPKLSVAKFLGIDIDSFTTNIKNQLLVLTYDIDLIDYLLKDPLVDPNTQNGAAFLNKMKKMNFKNIIIQPRTDIVIKLILSPRTDPSLNNNKLIKMAISSNNIEIVKILLPKTNANLINLLEKAGRLGYLDMVKLILTKNVDPGDNDNWVLRSVINSFRKPVEIIKLLLSYPNVDPTWNDNILFKLNYNKEIADVLLTKIKKGHDYTDYLLKSVDMEWYDLILKILRSDIIYNPEVKNNYVIILLTKRLYFKNDEYKIIEIIIKELLKHPKVNPGARKSQAFIYLVSAKDTTLKMVKLFLKDKRVNPHTKDNRPEKMARKIGNHEIANYLSRLK